MSKLMNLLIRVAKKNKVIKKAYQASVQTYLSTNISEITPFNPRTITNKEQRINLLVPSINEEHLFGGISTAINFYNDLLNKSNGVGRRIITTDASPGIQDLLKFSDYKLTTAEANSFEDYQIVPFNDRYNKTIPVGANDIFIATSWWTAYFAQRIARWQAETYGQTCHKIIYFIQDFEPGFYPWSSQYSLADSTYRYNGPQIAVFNSSHLKDYFINQGYVFEKSYFFEPRLNQYLKQKLVPFHDMKKEKQILIYGRPSVSRNAFTLIVEALRLWVWRHPNASEWRIISAGEQHSDIELGNGVKVVSRGKMTLEQYAEELKRSSAGISLMVSPHPSYPPLEMAHFGAKVLTNNYANKDLSKLHKNITSLEDLNPDMIALKLSEICSMNIKDSEIKLSDFSAIYLGDEPQFEFSREILRDIALKRIDF